MTNLDRFRLQFDNCCRKEIRRPVVLTGIQKMQQEISEAKAMWDELEIEKLTSQHFPAFLPPEIWPAVSDRVALLAETNVGEPKIHLARPVAPQLSAERAVDDDIVTRELGASGWDGTRATLACHDVNLSCATERLRAEVGAHAGIVGREWHFGCSVVVDEFGSTKSSGFGQLLTDTGREEQG